MAQMLGLRELQAALEALPKATARNTLKRVLTKAAKPTQETWVSNAPQDSGALKRSIVIGTRLTARQSREAKKDGKFFAEIHVGTADPAGVLQEYGTFKEPAQPSGRPAWDSTKDKALKTFSDELGTEIEKSAARVARKVARG